MGRREAVHDEPDVAQWVAPRRNRGVLRPRGADNRAHIGRPAHLLQRDGAPRALFAFLPQGAAWQAGVALDPAVLSRHAAARVHARAARLVAHRHPVDAGEAGVRAGAGAAAARRPRDGGAPRETIDQPIGYRAPRGSADRALHRRRQRHTRLGPPVHVQVVAGARRAGAHWLQGVAQHITREQSVAPSSLCGHLCALWRAAQRVAPTLRQPGLPARSRGAHLHLHGARVDGDGRPDGRRRARRGVARAAAHVDAAPPRVCLHHRRRRVSQLAEHQGTRQAPDARALVGGHLVVDEGHHAQAHRRHNVAQDARHRGGAATAAHTRPRGGGEGSQPPALIL
mmetsp:Transcript_34800/g.91597  ORF Transcript_34800/g.91597 Transcript_34800/m.91597 type:complete len:340 (+) Transcript_34800:313-1332(+)